ncbi:MAG: cytochrome c [Gemmatimonadaceae bacterium]|jgi:mono/diheme cytochrome c family protein
MNRVTKWVGRGLVALIGLLLIGIVVVYALSTRRMNKVYTVREPPLAIPTDSISVAKGQHFVQAIGKCATCHGDDYAGKVITDDVPIGRVYSANLTRGSGGIGASFTDADYVRAIRHGIKKDGRPMLFMPTDSYYYINDEDLANSIAYLKTLPAVEAVLPTTRIGPVARALSLMTNFPLIPAERIPHGGPRPAKVAAGPTREYGEYLVAAGACRSCHVQDLSGGVPIAKDLLSANITPAAIGKWTEADFHKVLTTGIRPDGRMISAVMPWPYTRFLTDEEIQAMWLYIHSLPPKNSRAH